MRDDDARGTWSCPRPARGTPTSNFSEEGGGESSGDSGEDLAQLSPPLTYDFGLDVHGFHC